MSYYAYGGGLISIRPLSNEEQTTLCKKIEASELYREKDASLMRGENILKCERWIRLVYSILANVDVEGHEVDYSQPHSTINHTDNHSFEVWFSGNYNRENYTDALDLLLPYLADVSLSFTGEDDTQWRITLRNGWIVELGGEISYDLFDNFKPNQVAVIKAALESYRKTSSLSETSTVDELLNSISVVEPELMRT